MQLEFVVWLVPSLIGAAVPVSFMNHAGCILPPRLLLGSIGSMAGFGQAGSAVLPFMERSRRELGSIGRL
ncbi:hypothetical protein LXA43DRAFT_904232 [Ganoderma leucocontextum]|nr:hypothetical protein LXA43DRAFT_904232 [Ganoderma leucocontextum]